MSVLAAFPADDPIWNTGGLNRTTPLDAKQALGWTVDEEPPSGFFNWWQFYVSEYIQHYKTAAVALNDGKLDRAGTNTITGNLVPDADDTRDLGQSGQTFKTIWAGAHRVLGNLNMDPAARIIGDLLPNVTNTQFCGSLTNKWVGVFANTVDASNLVVRTLGLPAAAGGASLGANSTPWANVVSRAFRGIDVTWFNTAQPVDEATLAKASSRTMIVALAKNTTAGAGAVVLGAEQFNLDGTTSHSSTGNYTFGLAVPISSGAAVFVCSLTAGVIATGFTGAGTSVTVNLRDAAGAAVDGQWVAMVIGAPSAAGAGGVPVTVL